MVHRLLVAAAALALTACSANGTDAPGDTEEETGQDTSAQTGTLGCVVNSRPPVWYGRVYSVTDVSSYYAEYSCDFMTWLYRLEGTTWKIVAFNDMTRQPRQANTVLRASATCVPGWYRTDSLADSGEWRFETSAPVFIPCK